MGDIEIEVHHVVPRASRGKDMAENLITLCKGCHDNEDWFDHIRAFKSRHGWSKQCVEWEYEVTPELLSLEFNKLLEIPGILEDQMGWVNKLRIKFAKSSSERERLIRSTYKMYRKLWQAEADHISSDLLCSDYFEEHEQMVEAYVEDLKRRLPIR